MLYVANYNELQQLATHASVTKLSFGHFQLKVRLSFLLSSYIRDGFSLHYT